MAPILFATFAVAHLVLLVVCAGVRGAQGGVRLLYLRVLLVGLMLDNVILASGNLLNGTPYFDPATRLRFLMHGTILPFLSLYALSLTREAGVRIARTRLFTALCFGATLFALWHGIKHEVIELGDLKVVEAMGGFRMTAVAGTIPVGTILGNVLMIACSVLICISGGPCAFLIGSAGIFVINATLTGGSHGFVIGNLAEVFFAFCLLVGEVRLRQARSPIAADAA